MHGFVESLPYHVQDRLQGTKPKRDIYGINLFNITEQIGDVNLEIYNYAN